MIALITCDVVKPAIWVWP